MSNKNPTQVAISQIKLLNIAVSSCKDTSSYSIASEILKQFKEQGMAAETPAVYLIQMQNDISGLLDDLIDTVWMDADQEGIEMGDSHVN